MIAPGNRVAAPQVSNPSRAGIYGKDGIRANENFNGDVMEELRRVKLALDAEVSQRVKLQERILDILPQMDSFDEALSATNRKVEELRKTMGDDRHRKDLLRQHGHELTTIGNAVNKIFSTLDHVTADVTALQRQSVVIKEENSDSVQSINSKLTAEIEGLRKIILKEISNANSSEQHFQEDHKKTLEMILQTQSHVNDLRAKLVQLEHESMTNVKKWQEGMQQPTLEVTRLHTRIEELQVQLMGALEKSMKSQLGVVQDRWTVEVGSGAAAGTGAANRSGRAAVLRGPVALAKRPASGPRGHAGRACGTEGSTVGRDQWAAGGGEQGYPVGGGGCGGTGAQCAGMDGGYGCLSRALRRTRKERGCCCG
jgi:hypothetical protein